MISIHDTIISNMLVLSLIEIRREDGIFMGENTNLYVKANYTDQKHSPDSRKGICTWLVTLRPDEVCEDIEIQGISHGLRSC